MIQFEQLITRGRGVDPCLIDFVTGESSKGFEMYAVTAYVPDKAAGKRVTEMFNGLVRVNFHPEMHGRGEVRIGAHRENAPALAKLQAYIQENEHQLHPAIIARASRLSPFYTPAQVVFPVHGVGHDSVAMDFVTGIPLGRGSYPNILAYVDKADVKSVMTMFRGYAEIRKRDGAINIGTAPENRAALVKLADMLHETGDLLTQPMVAAARGLITTAPKLKIAA
jgi:hypothetical protein